MKCPLQETSAYDAEGKHSWVPRDCLKEECAWWAGQRCCILSLNVAMNKILELAQKVNENENT